MRSVIGWQQTWWQWCGDDRKSSAVCQKKREKDTGSQGNSRRAEDDARSSKKQERGEAGREKEWKINRLGEQWEARTQKEKEGTALFVVVSALCRSWMPGWSTHVWYNYLTWRWPFTGNLCHLAGRLYPQMPHTSTSAYIFSMASLPWGMTFFIRCILLPFWQMSCFH